MLVRDFALGALCVVTIGTTAASADAAPAPAKAPHRVPAVPNPQDRSIVTRHHLAIGAESISYTATAGTLTIKNDKGDPEVSVFYVAYTQDGVDRSRRPVTFLYNGGPGSSSDWVHLGAFGPRRLVMPNAQPNTGPPYQLADNQYGLLDKSDLVFVDAPGTGYSKILPKIDPKTVWGMDEDTAAFGQFIERYVTFNDRWNSPKFLLGESYGTPRSAMLVDYLQNRYMAFNGVVLLSSVLDESTIAPAPGNDLPYAIYLPTEAAVHWYYDKSPGKGSLDARLEEARTFANGPYTEALMQGDRLSHDRFVQTAAELAHLTGLSQQYVELADLRILPWRFEKELPRSERENLGRYDARYHGYVLDPLSDSQDYDPSDTATSPAYRAMFLEYSRNELNYKSDDPYIEDSDDAFSAWDWKRKSGNIWAAPSTSSDLQEAMTTNPRLRVFDAAGYFDMATPFGAAEWTFAHLRLQPALRSHVTFGYYQSGHAVYNNLEALVKLHADLDRFYDAALSQ